MRSPIQEFHDYTLSEISADTGRVDPAKDFHVFRNEEIIDNGKMMRPSRSDHFLIVLNIAGTRKLKWNLIDYTLEKNSLFIVSPGIVHQLVGENGESKSIIVGFTTEFFAASELHNKYIEAFTFFSSNGEHYLQLNEEEAALLYQLMFLLKEKDLTPTDHPFRKEVMLHAFNLFMFELAAIFKKYTENKVIKLTRKETLLMNFVKLLAKDFKEQRSLHYYAGKLFVTPKHLSTTVKELTGKTGGEMIDEMVISEAKILLDNLSMTVGNVAEALHFSDQFFFSKFFKKHTGINPSEYKIAI
jgi:AraC-like DNA-binding protein